MACIRDHTPFGAKTSGVSLAVDVDAVLSSKLVAARLREQLLSVLIGGASLSLVITNLGHCADAEEAFSALCEVVLQVVRDAEARPSRVGIVIDTAVLSPRTAWSIRFRYLGTGPLFLRLQEVSNEHWQQLWRQRSNRMLRPVYALSVTSHCRLLPAEAALAVLPGVDIQAPIGSAWVAMQLDVSTYTNEQALYEDLRCAVQNGDRLHQSTDWPTTQMQHDAWLNRRLAIELIGIGDVLQRCGLNPGAAVGFDFARRYLSRVVDVVHGHSRDLAGESGSVPALEHADPGRTLPDGSLRDGWNRRWRRAVELHGVRHRNLFVLRPWALFPRQRPVDSHYSNLLPLLRYADACAFPAPPCIAHWNVNEFKNFHQRAWAALQQREAAHQIAEHV